MGRYVSTLGGCSIYVRSPRNNSLVLIGGITMSPASGISGRFKVFNKQQSNSPGKIRDTQKLDTSIDINFPNDWYSASIFSKIIGREPSHVSSADLYLRCHMDFVGNVVQTEAP